MNPYEYTFPEWRDHWRDAALYSQTAFKDSGHVWAQGYFREHYPDPAEACYKRERFVAALTFWDAHSSEFDVGQMSVVGDREALVGFPLVLAFFSFYGAIPDGHLGVTHPTVDLIRSVAESATI
jgi:hypothetical protein